MIDRLTPLAPYGPQKMGSACWARSGCMNLEGCDLKETFLPYTESNTRAANYALVASLAVVYERALSKLGYPRSLWGTTIRDFEAYEVARADREGARFSTATDDAYKFSDEPFSNGVLSARLKDRMKGYQAAHPQLQGISFAGGCGAGEVPIKIKTSPLAAQVFIIPTFYYEVCRAQGVAPESMSACDHWREVLAPIEDISGSYHYFVRWRDGVARRGILNTRSALMTGALTLTKP
jgi:hypothetical protein